MAVQRDKVIASAEKLVAKGKIEPAIKEYERLLEDNPNDVNTLNRIGDLWVRINRNDEAVKVFGKIADHYSKDGFFLKAIAIFKKINKLDPSKLEIYAKLADLYAKQGLAMEAKSQYQVLADYYLKHGDPANALSIYRKISELDPNVDQRPRQARRPLLAEQSDRRGAEGVRPRRQAAAQARHARRGRAGLPQGAEDRSEEHGARRLAGHGAARGEGLRQRPADRRRGAGSEPRTTRASWRCSARFSSAAATTPARAPRSSAPWPPIRTSRPTREALADLYLKQNDADRALEMIAPLVERSLGTRRARRGRRDAQPHPPRRVRTYAHAGAPRRRLHAAERRDQHPGVDEQPGRGAHRAR